MLEAEVTVLVFASEFVGGRRGEVRQVVTKELRWKCRICKAHSAWLRLCDSHWVCGFYGLAALLSCSFHP